MTDITRTGGRIGFGGPDYSSEAMLDASQAANIVAIPPQGGQSLFKIGDTAAATRNVWIGTNMASDADFATAVSEGTLDPPVQPGADLALTWNLPNAPIESVRLVPCWGQATAPGVGKPVLQQPPAAANGGDIIANLIEVVWPLSYARIFSVAVSLHSPDADNTIFLHVMGYGVKR